MQKPKLLLFIGVDVTWSVFKQDLFLPESFLCCWEVFGFFPPKHTHHIFHSRKTFCVSWYWYLWHIAHLFKTKNKKTNSFIILNDQKTHFPFTLSHILVWIPLKKKKLFGSSYQNISEKSEKVKSKKPKTKCHSLNLSIFSSATSRLKLAGTKWLRRHYFLLSSKDYD